MLHKIRVVFSFLTAMNLSKTVTVVLILVAWDYLFGVIDNMYIYTHAHRWMEREWQREKERRVNYLMIFDIIEPRNF